MVKVCLEQGSESEPLRPRKPPGGDVSELQIRRIKARKRRRGEIKSSVRGLMGLGIKSIKKALLLREEDLARENRTSAAKSPIQGDE